VFAAKKERSQALPVTQTGKNPAGDDIPVGHFEEEHPKTCVPIFATKKQHSVVLLIGVVVVVPAATRLV
jgi:hypothetical protein